MKYLQPNDAFRGLVLAAIYFVKNGYVVDTRGGSQEKYGYKVPSHIAGMGHLGTNSEVSILFVEKGQSWYEMGCKVFSRFT